MPNYTTEELRKIYERTNGNCHICHGRMALKNYGVVGARSAWEIDHSVPRARDGRDHGNNLFGAHIPCNRSKGIVSSRAARARNGVKRAPLSKVAAAEKRTGNTVVGVAAGGVTGAVAGALSGLSLGLPGGIVGGIVGGLIGNSRKVK